MSAAGPWRHPPVLGPPRIYTLCRPLVSKRLDRGRGTCESDSPGGCSQEPAGMKNRPHSTVLSVYVPCTERGTLLSQLERADDGTASLCISYVRLLAVILPAGWKVSFDPPRWSGPQRHPQSLGSCQYGSLVPSQPEAPDLPCFPLSLETVQRPHAELGLPLPSPRKAASWRHSFCQHNLVPQGLGKKTQGRRGL